MSYHDDFGDRAIKDLENQYSIETIKRDIGHAERIRAMTYKYTEACVKRIAEISCIEFKWHVEIRKGWDYGSGKVEFGVWACNTPQVPDGRRHAIIPYDGSHRFIGNVKRPEAIEFARQLIEKYQCRMIIVEHLTLTKKEQEILDAALQKVRVSE